jgi:hypothetical protein
MTDLQMDGRRHTYQTMLEDDMMTLHKPRPDHEVIGQVTGAFSIDLEMRQLSSPPRRRLVPSIPITGD